MPQKDLNYRITGDSSGLTRATDEGSRALAKMEREARRLERQQAKLHNAMTTTGRGMALAGAAIAAGLALSVKAAIEWESAWTGVLKTVDGSPEQMAALEEEIRGLTAVLPATHTEIAAVAEAAGQLGVQRENVAAFTRTMIDMGEATNLSSDEAATALARFMNIMQTAPSNVDRLASAIVDLGNKGATTESEITAMALRIAGAGRTIGLSEQQVLGFAAALSNVGINAEAGGTAISKVFLEIDKSVKSGDENLTTFAQTAGMSAEQFARAYEQDAGGAIASFVAGLGRVQASGGDVNAVLSQLGLTEIRVSDALRRLAGSGDNLTGSLELSNAAWDENTALAEEAERRYGTTAAKLSIARNQVNDFAISIGSTLLPVLGDAAGKLTEIISVVNDLPGPLKTTLAIVAALTGALLLVGGTALIAVPRIVAFKSAVDQLAASSGRAAVAGRALQSSIGFLAGPWGAAIAAAVAIATTAFVTWGMAQAEGRQRAREVADTLDDMTGAFTDATRALVAHELEERGALEAAQRLGIGLGELTDIIMSGEDAQRRLMEAITASTDGMVQFERDGSFASGATSEFAVDTIALMEALHDLNPELAAGVEQWQRTNEASGEAGQRMQELDPAARDLADAFGAARGAADEVSGAVDDLDKELQQLFERVFGLTNAQDDLADAFDALREQIDEQREAGVAGAGAFDGMTVAARDNRDAAQELLEKYAELAKETITTTGSQEEAERVAKDFEDALSDLEEQTGINVREMEGYNDIVSEIDRLIEVTFNTPGVLTAQERADNLRRTIDRIDREITISFNTEGFMPRPGGAIPAMQHGGMVPGSMSARVDSQLVAATPGEFVVPRAASLANRAALEALRTTGQWPSWAVGRGGGGGGSGGGHFTGNLYVGREFVGKVEGMIDQQLDHFGNALLRAHGQGVGGAR